MTGEVAIRETTAAPVIRPVNDAQLDTYVRIVNNVVATEFVPKGLRGKPEACLACILYGRAIGVDPMIALREISVIDGNPTLSAVVALGKIRQAGHSVQLEETAESCSATGRRLDNSDAHTVTWTMADAERAKLTGKTNWQNYPRAMLRSRAITELARVLFSDLFAGLSVYTDEEMGAAVTDEHGRLVDEAEVIDVTPTEEKPARKASQAQHAKLGAMCGEYDQNQARDGGQSWEDYSRACAQEMFGVESRADLTVAQMKQLIDRMEREAAPFS